MTDHLWDGYIVYINADRIVFWSDVKDLEAEAGLSFGQKLAALGLRPDAVLWGLDENKFYFIQPFTP